MNRNPRLKKDMRSPMDRILGTGLRQLQVLRLFWASGPTTITDLLIVLNDGRHPSQRLAYTSLLTMCRNLNKRGILTRQRQGRRDIYSITIQESDFCRECIQELITDFFDSDTKAFDRSLKAARQCLKEP